MGFASGTVTFRRFAVLGKFAASVEQELLDRLSEHALRPGEFGVPDEEEYGWSGGRHVFDGQFNFEQNVFADAVRFALRIDTNRVPGNVRKAYQIMEEEAAAAGNPSGFISKQQKKDVKESVRLKIEEELRSGKYRRSKLVPLLWDVPSQTLYGAAAGGTLEKLMEMFQRTFSLELQPLSAGTLAARRLEGSGRKRDYEDFRPTRRFVPGPDGEGQRAEYPWVAKGDEAKDFLGNEFLLWLWHEADRHSGVIRTEKGEVSIFIDRMLELDCAYGQTGKDSLRGTGPSHMPEARDGLRTGKVPRKAGLTLHAHKQQYDFAFGAEGFTIGAAKLPDVEDAETPRQLFEERIGLLRDFCGAVDGMYEVFLKLRASGGWEGQVGAMRKWILQSSRAVAAVA